MVSRLSGAAGGAGGVGGGGGGGGLRAQAAAALPAASEVLSLRRAAAASAAAAAASAAEAARLRAEADAARDADTCAICMAARVDAVLVPCGHLLCRGCVAQLQTRRCPFDRSQVQSAIAVFRPR